MLTKLCAVESKANEMERCAHQLKQNMRHQFSLQLMKLPAVIRKMSVTEFCEVYHADINAVVSAEIIKSKNQSITAAPLTGAGAAPPSARKPAPVRTSAREALQPAVAPNASAGATSLLMTGFDINKLQGMRVEEQLRYIATMQSQLEAVTSQLKAASK